VIERLRASFSDRRIAIVASLVLLSLFVLVMIVGRVLYTRTLDHTSIAWNLLLAWVPFVVALVVYVRASSTSVPTLAGLSILWLLFFPNAPYIVTDLKYIGPDAGIPVLYDVLLFSAAAWTGLLLGLTSLYLMHGVARRFLGVVNAWAVVVGVLVLSSFGIYLGRVQRWNSWDVFTRPGALLGDAAQGLHARPLALTVLFASFLLATYLVLYSFARLSSFVRE
jgi:uncharacterized membrane protein